jgi:hypothetical protein
MAAWLLSAAGVQAEEALVGTWHDEPTLSQLGFIRNTHEFAADGRYRRQMEFLSFCGMGAMQPDCETYTWISSGSYALADTRLTLRVERSTAVLKQVGSAEPVQRDMGQQPVVERFTVELGDGQLTLVNERGEQARLTAGGEILVLP